MLDIDLDSMGGGLEIDGVDGKFTGKTMGGGITLTDVRGEARLKTMGGQIHLSDSELDGYLETMGGQVLFENVIGDVKGKTAVLVDDMIDTAGTITEGARLLREEGARQVYACATHAVFSGPAVSRLSSGVLEEVIVTNTIPIPEEHRFEQLTVLSVANLLGEAIWRIHEDTSVSSMFR